MIRVMSVPEYIARFLQRGHELFVGWCMCAVAGLVPLRFVLIVLQLAMSPWDQWRRWRLREVCLRLFGWHLELPGEGRGLLVGLWRWSWSGLLGARAGIRALVRSMRDMISEC